MSAVLLKDRIENICKELDEMKIIVNNVSSDMSDADKEELSKIKIYLEYYSNTILEMFTEIGKEFIKDNKNFTLGLIEEIEDFISKFKENIK